MKTGTPDLTASAMIRASQPEPNAATPSNTETIAEPPAEASDASIAARTQRPDAIDWSLGERARAALERQAQEQAPVLHAVPPLTDAAAVSLSRQLSDRLGDFALALGSSSAAHMVILIPSPT